MRILLVHNHYGSEAPSGENEVFRLEHRMLEARGHEVQLFERQSDEIRTQGRMGLIKGALATPWNPFSARRMRETVRAFKPDIVHTHNTFPMISPAVFSAASGAARVLTLHNYRLFCPAAIPMRDGIVCTKCMDRKSVIPALRYGCYRESRVATLPLAANVALHRFRGTWQHDVEAFVTLTEFQKDVMIRAGLPAGKVFVKPNFYPGNPEVTPWHKRPRRVVFVGRISVEKGVNDLIDAWLEWGESAPELVLVGDGPDREKLEARCGQVPHIRFRGYLPGPDAQQEISNARLLILPSRWFEGFPMVLREAFALSTPTLVSDLGPLPDLVAATGGKVFRAGDATDLRIKAQAILADEKQLHAISKACHAVFKNCYTEEKNYQILLEIYMSAKRQTTRSS